MPLVNLNIAKCSSMYRLFEPRRGNSPRSTSIAGHDVNRTLRPQFPSRLHSAADPEGNPSSSDRTLRPVTALQAPRAPAPCRASGLVQWRNLEAPGTRLGKRLLLPAIYFEGVLRRDVGAVFGPTRQAISAGTAGDGKGTS